LPGKRQRKEPKTKGKQAQEPVQTDRQTRTRVPHREAGLNPAGANCRVKIESSAEALREKSHPESLSLQNQNALTTLAGNRPEKKRQ
jgi:hypothetical protein